MGILSTQLGARDKAGFLTFFFLIYVDHLSNKTKLYNAQGRKGLVM